MRTLKLVMLTIAVMAAQPTKAQTSFGEIRGLITDEEFNPVVAAVVKVTQGGFLIGGTTTDLNGKYVYKPLNAGVYEITVMDMEHSTSRLSKINVDPNEATYVDVKMQINSIGDVIIEAEYVKPIVDKTMSTMKSIGHDDLLHLASGDRGDIKAAIVSMAADVIDDPKGGLHFRGGRAGAESYFVDGIKSMNPVGIPGLAIENLTFISGGVPAMYGDLTSGTVIITTRDYFSGIRAKNARIKDFDERQELKKKQKLQKENEANRLKEIELEKTNDLLNKK